MMHELTSLVMQIRQLRELQRMIPEQKTAKVRAWIIECERQMDIKLDKLMTDLDLIEPGHYDTQFHAYR